MQNASYQRQVVKCQLFIILLTFNEHVQLAVSILLNLFKQQTRFMEIRICILLNKRYFILTF